MGHFPLALIEICIQGKIQDQVNENRRMYIEGQKLEVGREKNRNAKCATKMKKYGQMSKTDLQPSLMGMSVKYGLISGHNC